MKKAILWLRDFIYGKDFANKSKTRDYFLIPLYALLIAVIFRSLAFDNFHIPTGSMKNTLMVGDKITVSMFSYGYSRHSFPFGVVPIKGRIFAKKPERGDVIVFKYPQNTNISYVKRLVGMPGERLQMLNGELYINGKKLERTFTQKVQDEEIGMKFTLNEFEEVTPEGKKYKILKLYLNGEGMVDSTKEFVIPENHYFFMGDNRDFSKDSRFEDVGFVHEELLVGRVERVLISSPSSLLNIFDWHNIRFNRIFIKP